MGLSYKAAWDQIEAMNQLAGEPLVQRQLGGRGGGSSRLTEQGRRLVARYAEIDAAHQRFLRLLNEGAFDLAEEFSLLKVFTMKTSARNQYVGTVVAVRAGAVNDEVELAVPDGPRIVAVITRESTEALGLKPRVQAIALVKSSSVLLATEPGDVKLSARNRFDGTVRRIDPGAVNSEVTLDLTVGGSITAVVTHASVQAMGLEPGSAATAFFKASSVVLAVTA